MLLDPKEAEREIRNGRKASVIGRHSGPLYLWKGRNIEDQFNQSPYSVFDYIYGKVTNQCIDLLPLSLCL
jgi:hypothetical protein